MFTTRTPPMWCNYNNQDYIVASFYFCILYYNQPAYAAIIKEIYSRAAANLLGCLRGVILCFHDLNLFVLYSVQWWKLTSYRYAHIYVNNVFGVIATHGIDGVLIWLHRKLILTCLCSKWKNKSWFWRELLSLCLFNFFLLNLELSTVKSVIKPPFLFNPPPSF